MGLGGESGDAVPSRVRNLGRVCASHRPVPPSVRGVRRSAYENTGITAAWMKNQAEYGLAAVLSLKLTRMTAEGPFIA